MEGEKEELTELLASAEEARSDSSKKEAAGRQMWLGDAILEGELSEFARARELRLVFIAGMPASGKTTLLAAIYDRFLRGPYMGYTFAGSRSLPRFEEISYFARIESELEYAATQRTRFKHDVELVHLDLERSDGSRVNVLLSDISGESFEHARNSVADARRFSIARYADTLAIMVDGSALANPAKRNVAVRDVELTIDSFARAGLFTNAKNVYLVVSRIDLVPGARGESHWRFIETATEQLKELLARQGLATTIFEVAARPQTGDPQGIGELFSEWLLPSLIERPRIAAFEANDGRDDFGMHEIRMPGKE